MDDLDGSARSTLKVYVAADRPVDARDAAKILTSLDRAFSRFARDEIGLSGVRLQIASSGVGSWWATLIAAKELVDLAQDYPDLIPIFINNVDVTYRTLVDQTPDQTQKYLRDLVRDLARAGQRAGAKAVDLISLTRAVIAAEDYDVVLRADEDSSANEGERRMASNRQDITFLTQDKALEEAGQLAEAGALFGTIFLVDGSWYARAEGFGGVLLPLQLDTLARLAVEDGAAYKIEGSLLQSARGHPTGIAVRRVIKI